MEIEQQPQIGTTELLDFRVLTFMPTGQPVGVIAIQAHSDEDAIAQARLLAVGLCVDLWQGLRFVEHLAAREPVADCLLVVTTVASSS